MYHKKSLGFYKKKLLELSKWIYQHHRLHHKINITNCISTHCINHVCIFNSLFLMFWPLEGLVDPIGMPLPELANSKIQERTCPPSTFPVRETFICKPINPLSSAYLIHIHTPTTSIIKFLLDIYTNISIHISNKELIAPIHKELHKLIFLNPLEK